MSSTLKMTLSEILQAICTSNAKYVTEHKDTLSDMSEDQLVTEFMKLLDAPRTFTPVGVESLAPSLNGFSAKPTVKKTRTTTAKDVPKQEWMSLEDYVTKKNEGEKRCAFFCERSKEETKNNKVCGALCEDAVGDDPLDFRCVSCKGKAGPIKKKLEKISKPSPRSMLPGFNVPLVPTLPPQPGPLNKFPPIPGLPAPTLPMPVIPSVPTVPVVVPEIATPVLPVPTPVVEVPVVPVVETPAPVVEVPAIPVRAPTPEPEEPTPSKMEWLTISGLANHFTTNMPGYKKLLFKLDSTDQKFYCIGRINSTQIDANATNGLVQLTDKETAFVATLGVTYRFEGQTSMPVIMPIPGLPNL